MQFKVSQGKGLRGDIAIPGDKSISHRAVMLASLAEGKSKISGLLEGEDCLATVEVFKKLGVSISKEKEEYIVEGKGLQGLNEPISPLDFGNSGTSVRLCAGLLAAQEFSSTLIGDSSLSSRPMRRIIDPLSLMGADIAGSGDGTLPLKIQPSDSLKPITYSLPVASAQVKSCLMFASLYAQGVTELEEKVITRDHTERMFKQFNIPVEINRLKESNLIKVKNVEYIAPQDINICGDFSLSLIHI